MQSAESGARNGRVAATVLLVMFSTVLVCAARELVLAQKLATLEKLPSKFSFIVLGDNRAGDPACDAVYQKLITAAMDRKPDLIVNTGDQIDKPGNIGHWKRFWEMSKSVTVPYFTTVGNHDAHIEVAGSEETYRSQVDLPGNELYYSFVAGNALFIVLDSYIRGEDKKITGEQYTWLATVLEKSLQRHKFIFVHHPLYPEAGKGKHHGNSLDRYPADRDRLQALFKKHGVTMVFAGHEHYYHRKNIDGIVQVITGGGGAPLYADDVNGGFHHYVLMAVDGDSVHGEVVGIDGMVKDRF